jgi:hypothetical protein
MPYFLFLQKNMAGVYLFKIFFLSLPPITSFNSLNFKNLTTMKCLKFLAAIAMLMMAAACSKSDAPELAPADPADSVGVDSVDVTFEVRPDGWTITRDPIRTRGLDADGKAMTDIWVLDYVADTLYQQKHQSSTDDDFGTVAMTLPVGTHHIYFVASRGSGASLDTDAHTLTFTKVLDTFYKDLALNVQASTNGAQAVNLDRVVTKLKLQFTDAIPDDAATFNVTPTAWYYGLDYLSGEPAAAATSQKTTITIPASSIGKTGEYLNIFGFSSATEWTTDVAFDCEKSDATVLGAATISSAKFKRNRVSAYSGPLFSSNGAMTLSLNSEWDTELTGTW